MSSVGLDKEVINKKPKKIEIDEEELEFKDDSPSQNYDDDLDIKSDTDDTEKDDASDDSIPNVPEEEKDARIIKLEEVIKKYEAKIAMYKFDADDSILQDWSERVENSRALLEKHLKEKYGKGDIGEEDSEEEEKGDIEDENSKEEEKGDDTEGDDTEGDDTEGDDTEGDDTEEGKIEKGKVEEGEIEDDSDEDDEDFKKFEQDIKKDLLLDFHPQIKQISHKEMITLCKIVRNKKGLIIDPLHTTIPFLTKFEKARIIGLRAKQINNGCEPFIDVPPNMIEGLTIAEKELEEKNVPFIIRRPLPNGVSEYWKINDLEIL